MEAAQSSSSSWSFHLTAINRNTKESTFTRRWATYTQLTHQELQQTGTVGSPDRTGEGKVKVKVKNYVTMIPDSEVDTSKVILQVRSGPRFEVAKPRKILQLVEEHTQATRGHCHDLGLNNAIVLLTFLGVGFTTPCIVSQ